MRNNYRDSMPFTERVLKDITSLFHDGNSFLKNGGKLPVIVTYPDYPSKKTTIHKIARWLNYRLTNKALTNPKVVVFFEDRTNKIATTDGYLKAHPKTLNLRCTDISKINVDKIHLLVFGYNTLVNPATHVGLAVEKSDENARHDGRIITCPSAVDDSGKVYQIVIDNKVDEHTVFDYRVPVICQNIPLVYKKFKTIEKRFTNDVYRSELCELDEHFNIEEQSQLLEFAQLMNVDFAEFDVLRDSSSGKIYIIDVNTTPYGPPAGLPKDDSKKAVIKLANTFKKFLDSDVGF
jgi:hypothetical protein